MLRWLISNDENVRIWDLVAKYENKLAWIKLRLNNTF
jgi:hypothetical protein